MDAFFASVEQRDFPEYKGKPLIVGGLPYSRGVVSTCSYEARKFGVHSAMPTSKAYRLCPQAIFVKSRFSAYKEVSNQIREIFFEYSDFVEPLSLDEAFLDVTDNKKGIESATVIAREIREKIRIKTRLTASAGVSFNKFLAKAASDYQKPDGLTVVTPERASEFISQLPIGDFFGVGKVTEKKMLSLGIKNGKGLLDLTLEEQLSLFGKQGQFFYNIVRGVDDRPVNPHRERKSIGKEITFSEDIKDIEEIKFVISELSKQVEKIVLESQTAGKSLTLKIKYFDFVQITRSVSFENPIYSEDKIYKNCISLLEKTEVGKRKIRLVGVTLSNLTGDDSDDEEFKQLTLPL